jgi:hypothetical protein
MKLKQLNDLTEVEAVEEDSELVMTFPRLGLGLELGLGLGRRR